MTKSTNSLEPLKVKTGLVTFPRWHMWFGDICQTWLKKVSCISFFKNVLCQNGFVTTTERDCHMIAALADLYIRSRNIVRNFWISKSRTYSKFVVVWDLDTHTAFEANPSQTHERKGKYHSTKANFSCHSSYLITIRVNQICRTKVIYSWYRIFKQGSQHPSSLRFLLLAATSSRNLYKCLFSYFVCVCVCLFFVFRQERHWCAGTKSKSSFFNYQLYSDISNKISIG